MEVKVEEMGGGKTVCCFDGPQLMGLVGQKMDYLVLQATKETYT